MHIFKLTFVKNEIDSCKVAHDAILDGNFACEEHHGYLIHALIKADSEDKARDKAREIAALVSAKNKVR